MDLLSFDVYPFCVETTLKGNTLREGLLFRAKDQLGKIYYSEASPLPNWSTETLLDVKTKVKEILPILADIFKEASFEKIAILCKGLPSLSFALQSLLLQSTSPGLYDPCPVNGLLIGSYEEIIRQIPRILSLGFKSVKLKTSLLSESEVALIIHELKNHSLSIRLDINRKWAFDKTVTTLKPFSSSDFDYIEEPTEDVYRLHQFPFPLALDETLRESPLPSLTALSNLKAAIFKPTLHGGLYELMHLKKNLPSQVKVVLSSSFESGVGLILIAKLSRHIAESTLPIGLDTYQFLKNDVLKQPLHYSNGYIHPPRFIEVNAYFLKEPL